MRAAVIAQALDDLDCDTRAQAMKRINAQPISAKEI